MLSFPILSCLVLPHIQQNIILSAVLILFSCWFFHRPTFHLIELRRFYSCAIKFSLQLENYMLLWLRSNLDSTINEKERKKLYNVTIDLHMNIQSKTQFPNVYSLNYIENEIFRNLGIVLDSSVETSMIRLYNFIHNLLNNITLLLQKLGSSITIFWC